MPNRVRVEWTGLGGAPYLSTFYLSEDGAPTPAAAVTAVQAFLTALKPVIGEPYAWRTEPEVVTFSNPSTPTGTTIVESQTGDGDSDDGILGRALQGLVQLRTGQFVGARQIQGRLFIPGPTVSAVDGFTGKPRPTYISAIVPAATQLMNAGWLVASRKNNLFYEVSGVSVWSEFAVLRSRRD